MTPERLQFVLEHCFQKRRKEGWAAHYGDTARFLGVSPMTLRRWLKGERPVPRQVEIILEIFHFWPEVRAELVDKVIEERARLLTPEKS